MSQRESLYRRLSSLPRPWKRAVLVAADCVVVPLSLWLAFALRLGEPLPPRVLDHWWLFLGVPALTLPAYKALGLYRAVTRHMGSEAVFVLAKGACASALIVAIVALLGEARDMPRSVPILHGFIVLIATGGYRMFIRSSSMKNARPVGDRQRVIIYGAGNAGVQAAGAFRADGQYEAVAFVDDDHGLWGSLVHGLKVHAPAELAAVAARTGATEVLLALPSTGRGRRREIIEALEPVGLHVKTLPSLADLVAGHARFDELRDIDIEDLLGRDPVPPDRALLEAEIVGRTVMVTGAGGSIGRELCRQIVALTPHTLLLVDLSEFSLYTIEQELQALAHEREGGSAVRIEAFLGSAGHPARMEAIMTGFEVDTVFHAAAYKHVPLVERNVVEGVRNNVFSTLYCARAAAKAGVGSFVLVSTDKAVRPTNVMGASKRLAELTLQALAGEYAGTRFTTVRFGNVLDSSGSVVPLFREQIRRGGPVTVTHEDVTRYFMTIPEAVELVLQAGTLGRGGDVLVLDMGEPVRIADLAHRMIHLMGLEVRDSDSPHGDIEVRYVGLRPGEKLHEELLIGEAVASTDHPKIMRAEEKISDATEFWRALDDLENALHAFDPQRVRTCLLQTVQGYVPECDLEDGYWRALHPPFVMPTTMDDSSSA